MVLEATAFVQVASVDNVLTDTGIVSGAASNVKQVGARSQEIDDLLKQPFGADQWPQYCQLLKSTQTIAEDLVLALVKLPTTCESAHSGLRVQAS